MARVWADKVSEWVALGGGTGSTEMHRFWMFALDPFPQVFGGISPLAGLLQAACVLVLLRGVEMGKRVTTVMTAIKVCVLSLLFGGSVVCVCVCVCLFVWWIGGVGGERVACFLPRVECLRRPV